MTRFHCSTRSFALSFVSALAAVLGAGCHSSSPAQQQALVVQTPRDTSYAPQDNTQGLPLAPDPKMTPGAVLPVTREDICVPGYTKKVRNVPEAVKRQVYASYGITSHKAGDFEVDHLISLELGGSNSPKNLWPSRIKRSPGMRMSKTRWKTDCTPISAQTRWILPRLSMRLRQTGSVLTSVSLEQICRGPSGAGSGIKPGQPLLRAPPGAAGMLLQPYLLPTQVMDKCG